MKAVIFALAIAGVASTAPLNAQILGGRPPTPGSSRSTSVNGSWQVVGQDRNGNTIYERRTYDANGNITVQRARRDVNGNFSILGSNTVQRNGNSRDCQVASTNGTVSDIILGRSGTADCRNDRRGVDGVWRQLGRGRNNNSVYERRTLDANGNVVIQKARRNSNGTFTILSTHTVRNNQGGVRNRNGDDNERFDRRHGDNDDNDDNDDRFDSRQNDDDHRFSNSEHKDRGRGKGHKGRD